VRLRLSFWYLLFFSHMMGGVGCKILQAFSFVDLKKLRWIFDFFVCLNNESFCLKKINLLKNWDGDFENEFQTKHLLWPGCSVYPRIYTTPRVTLEWGTLRAPQGVPLGNTSRVTPEIVYTLEYTEQPAPRPHPLVNLTVIKSEFLPKTRLKNVQMRSSMSKI